MAIILARLAHEDRFHRSLHVVVDAAPTDAAVKLKSLVVRIEHQFLCLAEVGAHEWHAAMRLPSGGHYCERFRTYPRVGYRLPCVRPGAFLGLEDGRQAATWPHN